VQHIGRIGGDEGTQLALAVGCGGRYETAAALTLKAAVRLCRAAIGNSGLLGQDLPALVYSIRRRGFTRSTCNAAWAVGERNAAANRPRIAADRPQLAKLYASTFADARMTARCR
jgi:hypothetical protein